MSHDFFYESKWHKMNRKSERVCFISVVRKEKEEGEKGALIVLAKLCDLYSAFCVYAD